MRSAAIKFLSVVFALLVIVDIFIGANLYLDRFKPVLPVPVTANTPALPPIPPTTLPTYNVTQATLPVLILAEDYHPDGPGQVNGLALDEILLLPDVYQPGLRAVYAAGLNQGNNAHAFSVLGDSTSEKTNFLSSFDTGPYNLGEYTYLQNTISHFQGSFAREDISIVRGLHSWSIFSDYWADPARCEASENILDCEFRTHRPGLLIIRLGSNDAGRSDLYDSNMRRVLEYCLERGVIPVLTTKADLFEGADDTNNQILRSLAEEYDVPLWDFERLAITLPGRGLREDGVHLTGIYPLDYTLPEAFQTGYGMLNLSGLIVLDRILHEIMR